ncbi:AraC family transcriptional regulator [Niabella aquatica]
MEHEQLAIKEITPLSDKDCFYIVDRHKTEFNYPIHIHEEYELNFVLNAPGVRRVVGDSMEVIGEYDLVLITGKNLEHTWEQYECRSKNIREITVQFSPELLFPGLVDKKQFSSIQKMVEKAKRGLCFPMAAIMKVYATLEKMASEEHGFYSVVNFLTLLYELSLFTEDSRELCSSSFSTIVVHAESRRVQRVQKYINDHFREPIRLEQLAGIAHMAPNAFCRFFKLRTGKPLFDYVIDIRIGYASRLLVNTKMAITEICYESGFNNLSNFNRLFRKKKNCTPKEFRENYRKTKIIV